MLQNDVEQLLKPVIEDMGYELWGCEYLPQGKYAMLRIYIDKTDGITIDDCERVSRQVSSVLDVEDPIPGNYNLEVSSPGIPRPIFYPWQYKQFIGQDVTVKLFKPVQEKKKLKGRIVSVDEERLVLSVEDEQYDIPISNIVKAKV